LFDGAGRGQGIGIGPPKFEFRHFVSHRRTRVSGSLATNQPTTAARIDRCFGATVAEIKEFNVSEVSKFSEVSNALKRLTWKGRKQGSKRKSKKVKK
jgi:hypothetical protein